MALKLLCSAARNWKNFTITNGLASQWYQTRLAASDLLKNQQQFSQPLRSVSFLNKVTGNDLWKSVTSVSNAGKKRGRGKRTGKGLNKDLNAGQIIGQGRKRLILPGLNVTIKKGSEMMKTERGIDDPSWTEKLYNTRDMRRTRKSFKISTMDRGYAGVRLAGRSIGQPDPIGAYSFDGFDSRVIEMKIVNVMRGNLGRYRRQSTFVVTGNGQGVCGFAMGKSCDAKAAIRIAKNRAAQRLMHFELCDNRTVYHDFFSQFGPTKIYAYKMPAGYGLQTHRVIKTLCQLIGIKDLRTRIEGSTNPQSIVKAFLVGLLQQKSYDKLAEEKKLFLVEFDERREFFPRIVGVPSKCRTADEIPKDENLDFKQHILHGKVILKRAPRPKSTYEKLPGWQIHLKRTEKHRVRAATKLHLRIRYGELRSFLTDKYPEARSIDPDKY